VKHGQHKQQDDHLTAHLNGLIAPPEHAARHRDFPVRESHTSNATHLRVESIIDAGSTADGKSFANSPQDKRFQAIYGQLNIGMSVANPTPQMISPRLAVQPMMSPDDSIA